MVRDVRTTHRACQRRNRKKPSVLLIGQRKRKMEREDHRFGYVVFQLSDIRGGENPDSPVHFEFAFEQRNTRGHADGEAEFLHLQARAAGGRQRYRNAVQCRFRGVVRVVHIHTVEYLAQTAKAIFGGNTQAEPTPQEWQNQVINSCPGSGADGKALSTHGVISVLRLSRPASRC